MICNTYKMFFASLSDDTKLEIIQELRKEEKGVSELCRKLKKNQSTISHSLSKLKELGFVLNRTEGKQRIYAIDPTVIDLLKLMDKHVDKYYAHYCKCQGEIKKKRWGKQK